MKISWNWKSTCGIFVKAHHDEVWMISDLHYDHKANAESDTALLAGMWWMEFLWNATDTIAEMKYPGVGDGFNIQQKMSAETTNIWNDSWFSRHTYFPYSDVVWFDHVITFQLFLITIFATLCLRMAGGVKH